MTFKEYLASRRVTDTPAGDFTSDAKSDRRLPDVTTWRELRSYIERRTADDRVREAAHVVWSGYQAAMRRVGGAR